jgi:hypothetical protein
MRKVLWIVMFFGLVFGFVLGVSLRQQRVAADAGGAGGGSPAGNGDVNGDGQIDISDAVYILSRLFMSGPGIVKIECPLVLADSLPETGQETCVICAYPSSWDKCQDWYWTPNCEDAGYLQDGLIFSGYPYWTHRFIDNQDGTVTDNCMGLMWQKDSAPQGYYTWQRALQYCEDLNLAGYSDWRLPNVRELNGLANYGDKDPGELSIHPIFTAVAAKYWSSTTFIDEPEKAWYVSSIDGHSHGTDKDSLFSCYVRAVRDLP